MALPVSLIQPYSSTLRSQEAQAEALPECGLHQAYTAGCVRYGKRYEVIAEDRIIYDAANQRHHAE